MSDRVGDLADLLRGRILRGLHAGSLRAGDRLPGSRELAAEFGVDHRVVLAAYRELTAEGTVEMRPRGGIYVSGSGGEQRHPLPSSVWLSEILAQGVGREIPLEDLHEWMRRAVSTLRLRAVVIQRSADQVVGLCRELRKYYGLEATGFEADDLLQGDPPPEVRQADLLLTTAAYEPMARAFADRFDGTLIVLELRPDLIGGEWRLLLKRSVYVVVSDARFVPSVREYFSGTAGAENLRLLVLGEDSLDDIPPDAPVYVTGSAREALGDQPIPGRVLPTARLLSNRSTLELVRFIVEANLRALSALRPQG